ncbi:MAG TPA: MFS transporter [Thermoplasmata archaeon]|nr:MFS transporter [Thermoplasmata archaeon]
MGPTHPPAASRLVARPWLLAFIPINAATSGFGTVLPLLILIPLHGAWTDVALAAMFYNVAAILGSLAWGWVADRYPTRRRLFLLNYGGFGVIYLLLAGVHSFPALLGLYTVIGFLGPSGGNASALLMIERFDQAERPTALASLQLLSILGSIVGILGGYFWIVAGLALFPLLYLCAALVFASFIGVWFGLREPVRARNPTSLPRIWQSLASHLRGTDVWKMPVPFFPKGPDLLARGRHRIERWVREELRHELPMILAATFLFNMTANLFLTSYTPYLYAVGLGAASIFLVNLSNNVAQVFVYPVSGAVTRRNADRTVQGSTLVRAMGYLATSAFTFLPLTLGLAFAANTVAFGVMGAAIAFYGTSSGILLYRVIEGRGAGSLIGLNGALGGIAAIAGAGLSGILSIYGSYRLVFVISTIGLLLSIPLWAASAWARSRRAPARAAPSAPPQPATS